MSAATADRNTSKREANLISLVPGEEIFAGVMVARDSSGEAVMAADAAGLRVMGRSNQHVQATDEAIEIERGVFFWENDTVVPLTAADIGEPCYVKDNQTVSGSIGTNAVVAGRVHAVTAGGVWVDCEFASNGGEHAYDTSVESDYTDPALTVTGQVQDAAGNDLAGRFIIGLYFGEAANDGTPHDFGDLAAATGSVLLKEHTADSYAEILSAADGSWGAVLTLGASDTVHSNAFVVGKVAVDNSGALVVA